MADIEPGKAMRYIEARYRVDPVEVARRIEAEGPWPYEVDKGFRTDLPRLFRDLGFTTGAEIGVWQADFSVLLCETIPGLHLWAVDPWVAYPEYTDHTRHDKIAGAYDVAKERLAPYTVNIVRKFSTDAAKDVPDRSLDFVYIDGNHSLWHVTNDLCLWTKKVKSGGIIAGHDYIRMLNKALQFHVKEAVDAYTLAYGIQPWFVLGHKVWDWKKRDRERSFFWVNP